MFQPVGYTEDRGPTTPIYTGLLCSQMHAFFAKWAASNSVSELHPTVEEIAEFLSFLFESKGLQPSTIQGYRTALADKFDRTLTWSIGSDPDLSRLVKSVYRDRPKALRVLPPWNLSLVLHVLSGPPFEPLFLAPPKFITLKTVFLLALASGHRRSELHALVRSRVSHTANWGHVTLKPALTFLAKNQDPAATAEAFAPVVIPAIEGSAQDRLLCPVRALRIFLEVSDRYRADQQKLFIAFKPGHRSEISPITLSGWLRQTIKLAYEQVKPSALQSLNIKPHSIRGKAASWALLGGSSVDQIVRACHWKTPSTFTRFYLADQTWQQEDTFTLGPCVSAGSVVQGQR